MRKDIILLLTLFLCIVCVETTHAVSPEIQTVVERARSLFDHGRWSDARRELLVARERLESGDTYERQQVDFYLAACAVELGSKDAEAALRDFETRYPVSLFNNDIRFSLGSYYCTLGNMDRAEKEFKQTVYKALSSSRKEQYDIRMGSVAFAKGNYDEAYTYFDRIADRSEYAEHALYYRSYIDYHRGHYGRAKQGFKALAKSQAYGQLISYYLLQIEFKEGNYRYVADNGVALLEHSAPKSRREVERVIAESWFRLEDYAKAVEYLSAYAAAAGEMGREENYLLGFSLYRMTRYAEAAECLRKACGADDTLTQNASYHLADCYLRSGDKQAAMQAFAMASNAVYNAEIAEDALFNYGKLQYELGGGLFNEAINVLNRYMAAYPASKRMPQVRALLIAAYYNSNNYDAAYEALKSYPNPDADLRAALQKINYFRGLDAYTKGDMTVAKHSLVESAAVNVSPKYNALTSFWLGEIAFAQGDYATAAAKYDAYLKRAPRNEAEYAMAHYNLGYCAFAREDMPQAGQYFGKFIGLYLSRDKYLADAYNRLGDSHYAAREFDEAVRNYDKAIALNNGEQYYARYKRAVTLGILGKTDAKQHSLRQIMATGQGDYVDDAAYELGRTFIAQERYADGAKTLESFLTDYPASPFRPQALSDLGLAYLNLGDKQKSLKYYDLVVSASPQSAEAKNAMQGIREIYVSQGDVDGYFSYAEKVGLEGDLSMVSRDSLSFASAQKLYLAEQNEAAAKSLRSYIKSYPKGYYMNDALYYLGDCYLKSGEREAAIETLAALAEQGVNQYTETVLEKLSEMTYADKDYDQAASAYRRLYDASHKAADKEQAMTGYVRATLAGGDAAKITAMVEDVAAHPDAGVTAIRESQFACAEQLRGEGKRLEAVKIYKKLGVEVRTAEGAASAYYVIENLFKNGDMPGAEKAVYAFTDKNSPQAYWLAKAYILLGDIYVSRGDNFQARATFQSVADGYSPADDGIVAVAKERIQKLN